MKKFALLFALLSASVFAQSKPDDYPVVVHVTVSRIDVEPYGAESRNVQTLSATIDGKKYELKHSQHWGVSLLRVGDYRARLIDDSVNSYELNQVYEFMFADGKTRKFRVVGTEQ